MFLVLLALVGCLAVVPACSVQSSATPPAGPPAPPPPPRPHKIVVIRLGDTSEIPEPPDADISDGLKHGGLAAGTHYTLTSRNAEGDLAKLPLVVDAALQDAPDLIIALHPATAKAAAGKTSKVPIVFEIMDNPFVIGLGENSQKHAPNVTGAYMSLEHSLMPRMVELCIRGSKLFGILFNPDDPESVAHKDALIRISVGNVPVATAEIRSEAQITSAVQNLVDQKVDAIFLTIGIGRAAPAVIEEATRAKTPVFGFTMDQIRAGVVMARLPDTRWGGFEAGRRAARVLNGEPPSAIPFIEGSGYKTVFNAKVSKQFGIKVPAEFQRDAVIYHPEEEPAK